MLLPVVADKAILLLLRIHSTLLFSILISRQTADIGYTILQRRYVGLLLLPLLLLFWRLTNIARARPSLILPHALHEGWPTSFKRYGAVISQSTRR